jgi:S1-C subfamily serine protease
VSDVDHASVTESPQFSRGSRARERLLLIVAIVVAALVGGLISRALWRAPAREGPSPSRPIVQIVRQQPGLPSLAATIDRLCPSIATIVSASPAAEQATAKSHSAVSTDAEVPAIAVSDDGWLLAAETLPDGPAEAVFGDGSKSAVSEIRTDPVSGLIIIRTDATVLIPLALSDQAFARVGDFGFSMQSPNGTGCSAQASMIGSDFLVDGAARGIFLRLQQGSDALPPGTALVSSDGFVIGVESSAEENAIIPAPLVAVIIDELIRNSPSPTVGFGFRAIDLTPELAARIGNARARGVGVALIQPRSGAERADLRAGDVVRTVDSSPVSSASELSRALDAVSGSATLGVLRGTQQLTLTIKRSANVRQNG